MNDCICVNCPNKCYEYENNSTSDKAYYEWTRKQDKCLTCNEDTSKAEKVKDVTVNVLDKIRAEIETMTPTYHNNDWSITDLVPISKVLKIVDKYKTESEKEK